MILHKKEEEAGIEIVLGESMSLLMILATQMVHKALVVIVHATFVVEKAGHGTGTEIARTEIAIGTRSVTEVDAKDRSRCGIGALIETHVCFDEVARSGEMNLGKVPGEREIDTETFGSTMLIRFLRYSNKNSNITSNSNMKQMIVK